MSPEAVPVGLTDRPQNSASSTEDRAINTYPEASPELIEDIRRRLAELPQDIVEGAHRALMHKPIQEPGSILYKAGVCLSSHELYEYRKTLFPPNSLVDPYTQGPPVLREIGATGPTPVDQAFRVQDPKTPPTPDRDRAPGMQPSGASLLGELRDIIRRYVILPPMAAEALALWVMHTYAFAARNVTVYIGIVSPEKRCGKTTLLTLLGNLANRSLVAANISPSALFRAIEETQPTLLIDEADTFLQARDELRGILNAGYKRDSAYVVRVASRKTVEFNPTNRPHPESDRYDETEWMPLEEDKHGTRVVRHSCWCPKVIAAIGRLPDTLADRCIVITMQRKTANEHCERMRDVNAQGLRAQCAQWVRQHRDAISKAQPALPPNLNDRAADIWEPLLAIADIAGGNWPDLARQAAVKLSSGEDEPTLLGYFLQDLRAAFKFGKVDRMFSRDIVELMNPMHDRPWEDLRRGREINEWWLGQHLRELGIKSRTVWIGDVSAKGYLLEDFEEAFRRYLPHAGTSNLQAPGSKEVPSTNEPTLTGQKESQIQAQFEALMEKLVEAANRNSATENAENTEGKD
jgi:hypothetical protein